MQRLLLQIYTKITATTLSSPVTNAAGREFAMMEQWPAVPLNFRHMREKYHLYMLNKQTTNYNSLSHKYINIGGCFKGQKAGNLTVLVLECAILWHFTSCHSWTAVMAK